jgi:hypothetical protein
MTAHIKTFHVNKNLFVVLLAVATLISLPAMSQKKEQSKTKPVEDTVPLLGLAGDNLDLYAVLDKFQTSKTIEAFEKTINDTANKINNLDLNLDKKIDFIKVVTEKDSNSFRFILRVDVTKTESQDVAVILLDKDKNKKISLQIVGDEELYGKDYVIEPKGNSSVTPNPGYKGEDPVTVTVPASTTTVQVVQAAPIVQYVYSPAYVPYYPPYYYGYYPAWFGFATVMAVGIYRSACWGYHGGYYGGHYGGGNNVIINTGNRNNINHYNNNRQRSNTVSNNRAKGNYGNGAGANRGPSVSNGMSGRQSSPGVSNGMSGRQSSPGVSNNMSNRQSSSFDRSPSASTRQSSNFGSSSPSRSYNSSSSMGGGGRSMGGGGSRSMGGGGGGRSMGGGRRG